MPADVLAAFVRKSERRVEREQAGRWALARLAEGPVAADEFFGDAEACGFSRRTMRRALTDLGLNPTKQGNDGPWLWALPPAEKTINETAWEGPPPDEAATVEDGQRAPADQVAKSEDGQLAHENTAAPPVSGHEGGNANGLAIVRRWPTRRGSAVSDEWPVGFRHQEDRRPSGTSGG